MTDTEYARKLEELDRLLNDPAIPMEPARIWHLLTEIAPYHGVADARSPAVYVGTQGENA